MPLVNDFSFPSKGPASFQPSQCDRKNPRFTDIAGNPNYTQFRQQVPAAHANNAPVAVFHDNLKLGLGYRLFDRTSVALATDIKVGCVKLRCN